MHVSHLAGTRDPRLWLLAALFLIIPIQGGVASVLVPALLLWLWPLSRARIPLSRLYLLLVAITVALMAEAVMQTVGQRPGAALNLAVKAASGALLLLLSPLLLSSHMVARLRAGLQSAWPLLALAMAAGLALCLIGLPLLKLLELWPKAVEKFGRGLSYATILVPILALALPLRQRVALLCVMLAAAAVSNSATAQLGIAAALVTLGLTLWRPVLAAPLLAGGFAALSGLVLSVCLWPLSWYLSLKTHLPYSWVARLDIWHYVGQNAPAHPWNGIGWGGTEALPLSTDWPLVLAKAQPHPHNAALQALIEYGLPGFVLLLVAVALLLLRLQREADRQRRAYAAAAAAAAIVVTGFGFDFNTGSLWSTLLAAGALWLAAPVPLSTPSDRIVQDPAP